MYTFTHSVFKVKLIMNKKKLNPT